MHDSITASSAHQLYLRQQKKRILSIKTVQVALLLLFFALWEICAYLEIIDPFIFSSPSRVFSSFWGMLMNGIIFKHVGITLFETILGFVLSTLLGTLIAILLWWNDFIFKVLEPYLVIFNSLPKTALAPIIIVWMGNNMKSIILTALMTSIVVTVLSVLHGFLSVDSEKIKLIYTFSGNKRQVLTKVILPSSVPVIISALKINVGLSFVGVIVGEFLVAQAGLGYLIVYGSQIFKLDWVMLSVILLAVMSAFLYKVILILEKRFLKWRE